tara:strand:+ start:1039 stop:1581 length:543 start_codon:yes stop_codon:yes gene_type:complete
MPEAFSNSVSRGTGAVVTKTNCSVAAGSTEITVPNNTNIAVGQLIDNQHFLAGTKVDSINGTTVNAETGRESSNSGTASAQVVNFLTKSDAYTSTGTKSILVGGTFANNTNNEVELTVHVNDSSAGVTGALVSKVPIPAGSSFVISDAGKTVLESGDKVEVYCNTDNALDVNLSILTGVN